MPETGQNDTASQSEEAGTREDSTGADGVDPGASDEVLTAPKDPRGRKTKYRAIFVKQARKLAALGATDVELADFFEVAPATLYRWRVEHQSFREATKLPAEESNDRVERRLYERAMGYETTETALHVIDGKVVQTQMRKQYPPDTAAAFIWLKNRRSQYWRDRHDIAVTGSMTLVEAKGPDADV